MIEYILIVAGLILLLKGANFLVDGSSSLAKKFGISSLAVGLTIVAFGTSLPELVVNVYASILGKSSVAFGNIIGSNIANILLILGISAIIINLKVERSTTLKEIPFALMAALVLFLLSNKTMINGTQDYQLTKTDGIVMLFFFIIFLYYVWELAKEGKKNITDEMKIVSHSNTKITLMIVSGLAMLYFGGKWTVDGAVTIARNFGISELLISSTIVAVGTSLPEFITSIVAAMKKEMEIAVGNIVGSNIFNIFFIMAISAIIRPLSVPASLNFDFAFLIGATVLLFAFMWVGRKHELERWQGAIFILGYIAYVIFLIQRG